MLVLNRDVGQWVIITMPDGREIRVTITRSGQHGARIGFRAPPDVRIDREEVARGNESCPDLGNH